MTQLHELPTSATFPPSSYILIKREEAGQQLDYKIDVGTVFAPYINRNTEVGTGVGQFVQLIDVGGNAALPAVDGSQLTNIFPDRGSDSVYGVVQLSDSLSSTLNAATGETAATPKAVRDLGNLKVDRAGDEMNGDLAFINNQGLVIRNPSNVLTDVVKLNGSNVLEIGDGTIADTSISCLGVIRLKNSVGTDVFTFNVNTGTFTGITASNIPNSPSGNISATNIQSAINELDSEKFDKAGGVISGNTTLTGRFTVGGGSRNDWLTVMGGATTLYTGISIGENGIWGAEAMHMYYEGDGTFHMGMGAMTQNTHAAHRAISFSSTNDDVTFHGDVLGQGNLYEQGVALSTRYLGATATAADSAELGGVVAASYARNNAPNTFTSSNTYTASNIYNDNVRAIFGQGASTKGEIYHNTTDLLIDLGNTTTAFKVRNGVADRFTFDRATGDFTATGNITGTSDKRVKADIRPIENALDKVAKIGGKTFERTDIETSRQMGVIAQTVQENCPEAVTEDSDGMLSVAYGNLAAGLGFAATNELHEIVKDQAREIEILKGLVASLLGE